MNYIVFDLEWNQSPQGHAGEHPRMPFEIIEIGAAKLNEKLEMTGEFRRLVKPKLYTKLHKYIKEILSYDENDLQREGVCVLYMGTFRCELPAEQYGFLSYG